MSLVGLTSRLAARPCGLIRSSKWVGLGCVRPVGTFKTISPEDHQISREGFWDKNKRMSRPISPHLTIYKFQMTSVLSITHRGTGVALSALLTGAAVGAVVLPTNFPAALASLQAMQMGPAVIGGLKFLMAWPLTYHTFNGCRHLAWDMGYGFSMPDLYKTGWTVVALSVVTALALAAM